MGGKCPCCGHDKISSLCTSCGEYIKSVELPLPSGMTKEFAAVYSRILVLEERVKRLEGKTKSWLH